MTDSADYYFWNHTPEGIAIQDARRAELTESQRLFKEDVLSSLEGQKMVKAKLLEAEEDYALTVRKLRQIKREAATCPDSMDWWWAWQIEQYEGSGDYRGWLKVRRGKVWRWRHLIQIEGMVATDAPGQEKWNLEAIKEIPIDSLIGYSPAWRSDQRWTFRCPVHNEKTASFVWYREQNSWHCFGCSQGGSVIDLVMQMENLSFVDACKRLHHVIN